MNDPNPKAQLGIQYLGFDWSLVIGHWGLVSIAFLLPAYLIRFSVFSIPTTLLEVLIWIAFLFGLLQINIRSTWYQAFRTLSKPILLACLSYLLASIFSVIISPHLETSLGILKGWIITPMILSFMIYAQRAKVTRPLIFSGLVMALLGLSQIGAQDRISGIYDVPNSLALFLAPLFVLAVCQKVWLPASFMFLALFLTQSVAGILSVVVGLSLCFVLWRLKFVWVLGIVLCAFLILLPKINYLLQPGSSAHVRLQLWSISWDLIKEHPWLGIGLGTFEPAYQQKLHERFTAGDTALPEFVLRDPHNWILSFWLNTGFLGLLSFVFLHFYIFYWAFKNWGLIGHWSLGFGVLAALLTLLIFGFVDTIYWKNDLATLHWLLLALALKTATGYPRKTAG